MCYHLVVKVRFHHFWILLEIFSRPSCSFWTWTVSILSPHLRIKGSTLGKDLPQIPKYGKKKAQNDSVTFSLSPFMFLHYFFVLLSCFWVSLVLCFVCFFMFLFVCFQFCFIFFFIKKKKKLKNQKNTKIVCVCVHWYLCTLDGHWNKVSYLCIFCNLDEHLNAQLNKWALWLVFVMSKIKWSLVLNTHITLFDGND